MTAKLAPALAAIVGASHVLTACDDDPQTILVRPGSTDEVSRCLALLSRENVSVVTVGGRTGLVDATRAESGQVALSTERLNRLHPVDAERRQVLAGAGAKLEAVQAWASGEGLRFGVDLGARGTCTIGGNVATNAGGSRVLRYGMMRQNIAGLEVVLADGTVLSDLRGLAKNNAGYDLKQIFVGSEGTLGVVTQALLQLAPLPGASASALLAFVSFDAAMKAAHILRARCAAWISAVEIMWRSYYARTAPAMLKGAPLPVSDNHPVYLLVQVEAGEEASELLLTALDGLDGVADGAVAQTAGQEAAFWAIRDASEIIEQSHPRVLSFDVSLRPRDFPHYLAKVEAELARLPRPATLYSFGHLCDGNVHFMIGYEPSGEQSDDAIERCVYGPLAYVQPSSISAEHGIGREKAHHLWRSRDASEIAVMNRLRRALDPAGILNPHIRFEARAEKAESMAAL